MTLSEGVRQSVFAAIRQPGLEDVRQVSALAPQNPFYSSGYMAARRALGAEPWLLGVCSNENEGAWVAGCLAFLMSGRVNRSLEVPSWPRVEDAGPFWDSLVSFCRKRSVSRLELNSFASEPAAFPRWHGAQMPGNARGSGVIAHRRRCEYVLELHAMDLLGRYSSNHARNIKRARKAGMTLRRRTDIEACRRHAELMCASLVRRQERGETVRASALVEEEQLRPIVALVSHGAGELFQATDGNRVLSSILVLRAELGAYYHSAGTSPEGMSCGASHFLVHQIAERLRAEGLEQFNLGGADTTSGGLERFKTGFGATPIELEAAELVLAGRVRQALGRLGRSLEKLNSRVKEFRLLAGRWEGVP
jgi:hypothetical protein